MFFSEALESQMKRTAFSLGTNVVLPLWIFIYLSWIGLPGLDHYAATAFYLGDGNWLGKNSFICATLIHKFGKYVPVIICIFCSYLFLRNLKRTDDDSRLLRLTCSYVLTAIIICASGVSILKGFSNRPCPWSLEVFGGNGASAGKCYPAGHAGAAFCLLSLYFAARTYSRKISRLVLAGVVLMGFVYGISRQMQGAHFLSHTLATFALDWFICALLYCLFFRKSLRLRLQAEASGPWVMTALVCGYWVLFLNEPFFTAAAKFLGKADWAGTGLLASCAFILFCGYFTLFNLLRGRAAAKAILLVFSAAGAAALYFEHFYGVIFNAEMMRNVFATDFREASDYLGANIIVETGFLLLPPIYFVFSVGTGAGKLRFGRALAYSAGSLAAGLLVLAVSFQGLSSMIRGEPVLRNLIVPANVASSAYKVYFKEAAPGKIKERLIIDPAPAMRNSSASDKGSLIIVVVGETARKANWGLSGYGRDTTPMLRAKNVYNFSEVISCGTSTDVSLPCMFSRVGRSDYDRKRILREESLLPLLQRAGAKVFWVDNQSGCKGVCDGVEELPIRKDSVPLLCKGDTCYDGALLAGIDVKRILNPHGTTVVFMHQLGSHGPSYYKRYPQAFEKFKPVCRQDRLDMCTSEEIANAYDNTILYTDYFLSGIIDWLSGLHDLDTAMLYVSDHGESLGEKGLYLHGAPELIAPKEQKEVPMTLWLSDGMKKKLGLDDEMLTRVASRQTSHDELFSSILGLAGVESVAYDGRKDLFAKARSAFPEKRMLASGKPKSQGN